MLKYGETELDVKYADLHAVFTTYDDEEDTCLVWCIDIETEEGTLEEEEEPVSVNLYHENGFRIDDIQSWKDLEGVVLEWEEEENDYGEDAGFIRTFDSEVITEGKIEFLERNGRKYLVRWSGVTEYETTFEFEGELDFTGILAESASIPDVEGLKSKMTEFIDMDEFECVPEEGYDKDNGEHHNRWTFIPKD